MPRTSLVSRAQSSIESSPWVVPGALMGAYVLTRLPFGLLTGLAIGFAAGWSLRAEQEGRDRPSGPGHRRTPREEEHEEAKVDAMSDDSFPASDPPSYTASRTGKPKKS